jgi:formimidoylglutamate deiminase
MRALQPDFLFSGGHVHAGASLVVDDGNVQTVGEAPSGAEVVPLRGRALLPGLVAAHSHAFQRAIRGRTEHRSHLAEAVASPGRGAEAAAQTTGDDFWSWREAMYAAAERLSPEDLYAVSRFCFLEMARAGVTAVGEFHYLHRDPSGKPYADPNELDLAVARAAQEAGLRIVLLRVAYARSGFRVADNPRQKRFIEGSAEEYLKNLDALSRHVPVGAAPHSVRACPAEWIRDIATEAARRRWPLHLHAAEQRLEVEQCRAEHGTTPALLLDRVGALRDTTTAVHAVHLTPEDVAALGAAHATVCACPTTERNLGDGIVRADLLLAAGAHLCVGTDSEVQLSPVEDARQLEYHLRLSQEERAILDVERSGVGGLGAKLYRIASEGGMRSLGLGGGLLRPGDQADFIVVDLDDPSIAGANRDDLMANVVFSMERTAIRETWVRGEPLRLDFAAALPAFRAAMRRLWG